MASVAELVEGLIHSLHEPFQRKHRVHEFQDAVLLGESDSGDDGPGWDTLTDLATHFEFYQPDPVMRSEQHGLYGDDRLQELILSTLEELVHSGAIDSSVWRVQRSRSDYAGLVSLVLGMCSVRWDG